MGGCGLAGPVHRGVSHVRRFRCGPRPNGYRQLLHRHVDGLVVRNDRHDTTAYRYEFDDNNHHDTVVNGYDTDDD